MAAEEGQAKSLVGLLRILARRIELLTTHAFSREEVMGFQVSGESASTRVQRGVVYIPASDHSLVLQTMLDDISHRWEEAKPDTSSALQSKAQDLFAMCTGEAAAASAKLDRGGVWIYGLGGVRISAVLGPVAAAGDHAPSPSLPLTPAAVLRRLYTVASYGLTATT